jgi:vancomycin permeability regulator SanA
LFKVALVYGYGQAKDGSLVEQTIERCHIALDLLERGEVEKIYITTGSIQTRKYMGAEMQRWLIDGGAEEDQVCFVPAGFNTAGETDALLQVLKYQQVKVVPVTTWYHAPRMCWTWLVRGKIIWPAVSWHAANLSDLLLEPLKIINAILRPWSSSKWIGG